MPRKHRPRRTDDPARRSDGAEASRGRRADRACFHGVHRPVRGLQAAGAQLLGAPIAETVFEPRVGGGIVDRATDGSECRWARILAFDPPDRVVFSWDISPQWTIETDPAQASEVEVRFFAESPTRTRVELEHRHIDRHGPGWEAITDGVDGPEGWPLYLDRYAALVKEGLTCRRS